MPRKIVTVTHPDGTKKVIVGKQSNSKPIPSNNTPVVTKENDDDKRRPKPGTPKISITNEKNGYKYGGKVKFKAR